MSKIQAFKFIISSEAPPIAIELVTKSIAAMHGWKEIDYLFRVEIMQESVIYQDILHQGEQRGEHQEASKYTLRLLNRRFGEIDSLIIERLQVLSTEQLEGLGEAFLDFSNVSDLVAWLEQNTSI
ncbi:DUF4351 domain-containing protein [Nostoc sp.]|uniref:DUF4351 domain-containing protein n=1 Tax=Nostoc sp. TaxID=1180 RepID=UPI003FA6094A